MKYLQQDEILNYECRQAASNSNNTDPHYFIEATNIKLYNYVRVTVICWHVMACNGTERQ